MRSRNIASWLAVLVPLAVLAASCNKSSGSVAEVDLDSVMGVVANDPQFSTLWGLVSAGDVRDDLHQKRDDKTLFAPTNEAFGVLGQDTLNSLLEPENQPRLQKILRNHIVDGSVTAPQVSTGEIPPNQLGQQLSVTKDDTGATVVEGARVIRSIRATNGYVHVVDAVILPATSATANAAGG